MNFKNRQSKSPNRKKLKIVAKSENELIVDVERAEGIVYEEGTPIDAELFNSWESRVRHAENQAIHSERTAGQALDQIKTYAEHLPTGIGSIVTKGGDKLLVFDSDTKLNKDELVVSNAEPSNASEYNDGAIWIKKNADNTIKLWTKTSVCTLGPEQCGDFLLIGAIVDNQVQFPLEEIVDSNIPTCTLKEEFDYGSFNGAKLHMNRGEEVVYNTFLKGEVLYLLENGEAMYAKEDIAIGLPEEGVSACRVTLSFEFIGHCNFMALKFAGNSALYNHPFYFSLHEIFEDGNLMEDFIYNTSIRMLYENEQIDEEPPIDINYFRLEDIPDYGLAMVLEIDQYSPQENIDFVKLLLTGSREAAEGFDPFSHFFSDSIKIFFMPFGFVKNIEHKFI